jgi:hypothetical protein
MIGYDSCGRERIYRAQKAREAKVREGVERAVCGEGQTTTAVVGRRNTPTDVPSDKV